jgi:hypothetical protein
VLDHKWKTIAREVEQCLVERGIGRLLTISVDNATANDSERDWFRKRNMANNDVLCRHEFVHVRFCVNILNLIVHEDLKDIDDSIVRVQNMVKYVKGSLQRLIQFKYCAERKTIGCNTSLTLDVPTRWNFTYTMLEVAMKYERAFDLMLDEDTNFSN